MELEAPALLRDPALVTHVSRRWRPAANLAFVALAVYLTALFGLKFGLPGTNASPVWLAAGVELAAVLLLGRRALLAIFVGAVLAQLTVGTPLGLSFVQGVPDVADAFIAASQRASRHLALPASLHERSRRGGTGPCRAGE